MTEPAKASRTSLLARSPVKKPPGVLEIVQTEAPFLRNAFPDPAGPAGNDCYFSGKHFNLSFPVTARAGR